MVSFIITFSKTQVEVFSTCVFLFKLIKSELEITSFYYNFYIYIYSSKLSDTKQIIDDFRNSGTLYCRTSFFKS